MTYQEMQAKQLQLSIVFAVIFLLSMFTIPILNALATEAMMTPILGIPLIWLGVGFFLHLEFWAIAILYTVYSNKWESELSD
jgi:uncharacterized membrane protein (DUF485 family)